MNPDSNIISIAFLEVDKFSIMTDNLIKKFLKMPTPIIFGLQRLSPE